MSDPLSVAGTAVGITSLGIQVCQSLIKYLRAVRGRKEEIAEGVREVDRVVSLLCSLNNLLPRVGPTNETAQLRDCLKSCDVELKRVQTLLAELNGVQQLSNAMQRAANAMRSVTYPFQQEKLAALRQSLRSVLDDLTLIISIVSLASDATIQDKINTISQDLKVCTSAQASGISDLQTQVHCHSVQLRSLQSTISGTLDDITEQLCRTQLSIQDFDQRVDGKLTIIESGTQSIEASSQVAVAKLEEITRALASQSRLMENMSVQITGIQSLSNTNFATAEQNTVLQEEFSKALYKQSTNRRHWRSCHCASGLPKSKIVFTFWNMKFELEQQEHHLPSCKLWGTKKGLKRTAKATFPLKVAWLSAQTTLACIQYATGTSQPSLSIRCTNIVPQNNSPVYSLCDTFVRDMRRADSMNQFIHKIELLEREILTLYTCGRASPGDVDEHGNTHAEMFFDEVFFLSWRTQFILRNNALTHAFLSCIRTLLQAYNSDKDLFSFSRSLIFSRPDPDPFRHDTNNTKYLLSFMCQEACFSFSEPVVVQISENEPSDSLKAIIKDTSEISDIVKAILSRSIEDLEFCVKQNPESVLESIYDMNVLYLSATWPEGLRYLLTTDAVTFIDDIVAIGAFRTKQPILRVIDLDRAESVDILLGAGCCLGSEPSRSSRLSTISSHQVAMTIATHLSERRVRLLRIVQQQLGLFLDQTSVAFADSAAAEICASLDAAGVMIHPSLRVESDYRSIYSQSFILLDEFNCFWEKGFHHFTSHTLVGFTPIITSQFRWGMIIRSTRMENLVKPIKWLVKKGFMQEKTTDPLGLGLNASATGYHYLGALLAQCLSGWFGHFDQNRRALNGLLARQDHEDDCMCWCNADNHGCSPLKCFLITYVYLTAASGSETDYHQHVVLHHELFDLVTLGDTISHWIKGTLRLLTFEALEMTHTCCSFDHIYEHDPSGLVPEEMLKDKGIFCHDPVSVSRIRSSAEEQSKAALLEELMGEFTENLCRFNAGVRAFEVFIFTYWRRRISQLYALDPDAVEDLLQYQTFQGFGLSHSVRTRVLPETLQRLLGNDFLLTDHLDGSPSLGELTFGVVEYGEPYCRWCNSDDESQSHDGSELGEEEKEEACVDDESDC